MRKIIGLLGVKGAGKDSFARYLVDLNGFVRIGFADALYREAAQAFGVSVEFLGRRDTKETALAQLALANCTDAQFVRCVREETAHEGDEERAFLQRPRSPRFVLQLWGTEYRRLRGLDSYWLDQVSAAIGAAPHSSFVITDVRFKNEANFVENHGGALVRIRRPALETREALERAKKG